MNNIRVPAVPTSSSTWLLQDFADWYMQASPVHHTLVYVEGVQLPCTHSLPVSCCWHCALQIKLTVSELSEILQQQRPNSTSATTAPSVMYSIPTLQDCNSPASASSALQDYMFDSRLQSAQGVVFEDGSGMNCSITLPPCLPQ